MFYQHCHHHRYNYHHNLPTTTTTTTATRSDFSLCEPCGTAFTALSAVAEHADKRLAHTVCHVDIILSTLTRLATGAPPGVWVCYTHMLISLHPGSSGTFSYTNDAMCVCVCVCFSPPPPE